MDSTDHWIQLRSGLGESTRALFLSLPLLDGVLDVLLEIVVDVLRLDPPYELLGSLSDSPRVRSLKCAVFGSVSLLGPLVSLAGDADRSALLQLAEVLEDRACLDDELLPRVELGSGGKDVVRPGVMRWRRVGRGQEQLGERDVEFRQGVDVDVGPDVLAWLDELGATLGEGPVDGVGDLLRGCVDRTVSASVDGRRKDDVTEEVTSLEGIRHAGK